MVTIVAQFGVCSVRMRGLHELAAIPLLAPTQWVPKLNPRLRMLSLPAYLFADLTLTEVVLL